MSTSALGVAGDAHGAPPPAAQRRFAWRGASAPVCAGLAVVYAALFLLVPWESLSRAGFGDLDNYVSRVERFAAGEGLEVFTPGSLIAYVTDELAWAGLLLFFSRVLDDPSTGFLLVSFASLAVIAFCTMRLTAAPLLSLLLLTNPLVVDLVVSQLRTVTALALLLVALRSERIATRSILVALAAMVHTASLVLVASFVVARWLACSANFRSDRQANLAALLFGLALSVVISFGWELILGYLGDRRAFGYEPPRSSLLYASYWIAALAALVAFAPARGSPAVPYSIAMLSLVVFNTLFGAYGSRFIALALPLLIAALLRLPWPVREFALLGLIGFSWMQWIYWLDT